MIISESLGKWLLRLFPPLFFNRIWVIRFEKNYTGCMVKIHRSILNRNLNNTIFGGTIFSAADPFYSLLFWQIFARKKIKVQVWLKSAHIYYLKPANTSLTLHFHLSDTDIKYAEEKLHELGKFVHTYHVKIIDKNGTICATADTEVYIRKIDSVQKSVSDF